MVFGLRVKLFMTPQTFKYSGVKFMIILFWTSVNCLFLMSVRGGENRNKIIMCFLNLLVFVSYRQQLICSRCSMPKLCLFQLTVSLSVRVPSCMTPDRSTLSLWRICQKMMSQLNRVPLKLRAPRLEGESSDIFFAHLAVNFHKTLQECTLKIIVKWTYFNKSSIVQVLCEMPVK